MLGWWYLEMPNFVYKNLKLINIFQSINVLILKIIFKKYYFNIFFKKNILNHSNYIFKHLDMIIQLFCFHFSILADASLTPTDKLVALLTRRAKLKKEKRMHYIGLDDKLVMLF